jgi:serine/threonine-protein kinase
MPQAPITTTIGHYNLIASLGKGGMAEVYLAVVAGPGNYNKLLVLKILHQDAYAAGAGGIEMFWDEARLSAQLVHRNVVHTYEVGEIEGRHFLCMEYLDGQTYRGWQVRAARQGVPRLREELRILSETARGLEYAHHAVNFEGEPLGVVHRDVSPQNVFITYDGQIKLLDFGIAQTHETEHVSEVGIIKGKLDYIAPEQLRGEAVDGRSDLFSLGVMLWEAIAGKRFAGGPKVPQAHKVQARVLGTERKLRELKPDVPEELATIVDRAIALRPADRFPDAASFADALDSYLDRSGKRPSAKSLAAIIAPMFESERADIHRRVDERIAAIQRGDLSGELSRLSEPDTVTSSGEYLGPLGPGDTLHSGMHSVIAAITPPRGTPELVVRKRHAPLAAVVIGLALAAIAAVWASSNMPGSLPQAAASRPSSEASSPAAGTVPSVPPSTPLPTAALAPAAVAPRPSADLPESETSVSLRIEVSPPSARIRVDGAALDAPFAGKFDRSSAMHLVEVTADGYLPEKRIISYEQDQTLNIALEPIPAESSRSRARRARRAEAAAARAAAEPVVGAGASPAPAAAVTVPGAELAPRPRLQPSDLDVSNPYTNEN